MPARKTTGLSEMASNPLAKPSPSAYRTLLEGDGLWSDSWLSQKLGGGLRLTPPNNGHRGRSLSRGLAGPSYGLEGQPLGRPETVYLDPADDRQEVTVTTQTPWSAICHILTVFTDNTTANGTGFLISHNCVLTAGHVLINVQTGARPRSITVSPGYSRGLPPFGSFLASGYDVPPAYPVRFDQAYDIGVAYLSSAVGMKTGYLGFGAFADADLENVFVNIAGYPRDRPGQMVYAGGRVSEVQPHALVHNVDTNEGESGSPVIYAASPQSMVVLGVHSWGGPNRATRLSEDLYTWVRERSGL